MSTSRESNVAVSFYNIHSIITRGLQVSIENIQGARQQGFQDEHRRAGLFQYIRALASVVNSHHLTEDEIAFPYFQKLLPDVPFDQLTRWHQEMDGMLAEITLVLDKCEQNVQPETNLGGLENALASLNESWHPHIKMETDTFITKVDGLIPEEEQLRLIRQFSEHGQKIALPPELTLPFLLYNLPPQDRQVFSREIPAEVLQHLVPVVWKARWEAMTPYLLA